MILTQKEKGFILKNQEMLKTIFEHRIEELKQESSDLPRGILRDAKLDLVQEIRIWIRDINSINAPEKIKPDNLI